MTADMRAQMRRRREIEAEHLLHLGHSKSEVARRVGLSASRISAMFKGEEFPTRRVRRAKTDCAEEAK
jgi:transposase